MRLDSIASIIDSPQSAPGTTSRGAIQHGHRVCFEPCHDPIGDSFVFY